MREHPERSRWVALLYWGTALPIQDSLRARGDIALVGVEQFLPIDPAAVDRHLDATNLGWILSGVLDEWYGMWAPQAFSGERVSAMLRRLHDVAPEDPATVFLEARWFMHQRDFEAAEPLLVNLFSHPYLTSRDEPRHADVLRVSNPLVLPKEKQDRLKITRPGHEESFICVEACAAVHIAANRDPHSRRSHEPRSAKRASQNF